MQYLVRFDNVSLAFGDQVILSQADLRVEPGERLCLIGRNGSGKSTSLKLITGELEPDEGTVDRPANLRLAALEQSLAEAEKYELIYQAAVTRVRLLELRVEEGTASDADIREAREVLSEMIPALESQLADSDQV